MFRTPWAALVSAVVSLIVIVPAYAYPENYLSPKLGTTLSTNAQLRGDTRLDAILTDGPVTKAGFIFADVQQKQVFVVDFGQERTFDRVDFGTDNSEGGRCVKSLVIEVSSKAADGPYQKVFEKTDFGWFQVMRLPLTKARWVRFDLGESATGVFVRNVRIYKGYEHPKLVEVTKLLHEKIKPGLSGLEKFYAAADAGEWPKACSELRAYYAAKADPKEVEPNPKYDLSRAQDYYDGKMDFAGILNHQKVPIDWSYQKNTDWYEHKNFINRGAPIGCFVDAYLHTKDKKWADFWRTIFYDWIDANPKPEIMSGADYPSWRTLDSAARNAWLGTRFPRVTLTNVWEDELWANLLWSIWEHADYGKNDNFTDGNWLSINSASIMAIALDFPEFKDHARWLEFGKVSFEVNISRDVFPDGKEIEDAPGYVAFAYSGMLGTYKSLVKAGVSVQPELAERLGKIQVFLAAVTQPDGRMPAIGDFGGGEGYTIPRAMELFKREDIKYIWTKGKEGVKPDFCSILFPQGNWAVMRSAWDDGQYGDARHLVFKASSGSHGHRDELMITNYAYGRPLLVDCGIQSYEGEDVRRYTPTETHNTVSFDGEGRSRGGGAITKWISNAGLDYALATQPVKKLLDHRRDVTFVKPEYWILHDDIQGEGSHVCDQNWHFNEDAGIVGDPSTKIVRTSYATGGNLMMIPVDTAGLKSEIKDFKISRTMNDGNDNEFDSKGWKYSREGAAPQVFDLVMYPYNGANAPKIMVTPLAIAGASSVDVTALEVKIGNKTDYVLISRTGPREFSVSSKSLSAKGEVVVLRTADGKAVRLSGSNISRMKMKDKVLFEKTEPVADVDVTL